MYMQEGKIESKNMLARSLLMYVYLRASMYLCTIERGHIIHIHIHIRDGANARAEGGGRTGRGNANSPAVGGSGKDGRNQPSRLDQA